METFKVTVKSKETGRIFTDKFTCETPAEARHDFKECYRHGSYEILSVESMEQEEKAHSLYYKLHDCLKVSLDEKNNPLPNGDYLSCHTNNIIVKLAKSIESGETWYDASTDVWCDYFLERNK